MIGFSQATVSKRIVHVGAGAWGKNYLKTYSEFPITVEVASRDTWRSLIKSRPDGVVICTPPQSHVEIARLALEHDIPIMVEKPLALSLEEAKSLSAYTAPILVDHLYLFSDEYQKFKQSVVAQEVQSIETTGLGTKSHEGYSVLWDYGPHDIAIVLDLMGRLPERIFAKENPTAAGPAFDVELSFENASAHCRFGVAPERVRTVHALFDGREAHFEDRGPITPSPLYRAIEVFLNVIDGKSDPRVGVQSALDVLQVLEACDRSLATGASTFIQVR